MFDLPCISFGFLGLPTSSSKFENYPVVLLGGRKSLSFVPPPPTLPNQSRLGSGLDPKGLLQQSWERFRVSHTCPYSRIERHKAFYCSMYIERARPRSPSRRMYGAGSLDFLSRWSRNSA